MNKQLWYSQTYLQKIRKDRKRLCLTNVTYHTMSRCINKESLLMKPAVRDMVLEVLNLALEKYDFDLNDFVIMDNHFHFKIKIKNEKHSISLVMQFIKAQIAKRFNRMYDRTGPFWNERFKDSIIDHADNPMEYTNYLTWYFAYNPVKKGLAKDPYHYYFCGIKFYIEEHFVPPVPLIHDFYFLQLGDSFQNRVDELKKYEHIAIEMLGKNNSYC